MELKRRDTNDTASEEAEKEKPALPPERGSEKGSKKREISVIIYTSILFFVALVLILLSYFIQQRTTSKLTEVTTQHGEFSTMALQNIEELQDKNQELSEQLEDARDELETTRSSLEEAQRSLDQMAAEMANLEQGSAAAVIETEEVKKELETQRKRTEALELLIKLLSTPEGQDQQAILENLDKVKESLDGEYLEIYNSYIENGQKEG